MDQEKRESDMDVVRIKEGLQNEIRERVRP